MKTREIRIGNLGQDREGRLCRVEQLSLNEEPKISAIKGGLTSLPVEPIPLTEDTLRDWFGFEKLLNQYKITTSINKGNYKNVPFIILYLDDEFQYDDLRFRTNLQHVHQLQNLYFALTGEELTLNKTK